MQLGSLELLRASEVQTLFNTSDPALRTGSVGEETSAAVTTEVRDGGFDLVIMNPPFTRAGSDWEGSGRKEDSIKQFRGLSTSLETQKDMAARVTGFARGSCYHGYAGIASAFVALADRKVKPGGVVALVLPLSVAAGASWKGVRRLFDAGYEDLKIVSLAATGAEMSFSADTGMAECLVVARKRSGDTSGESRGRAFVSLAGRPRGFAAAATISRKIAGLRDARAPGGRALRRHAGRDRGGRYRRDHERCVRERSGMERRANAGLLRRPNCGGPVPFEPVAARNREPDSAGDDRTRGLGAPRVASHEHRRPARGIRTKAAFADGHLPGPVESPGAGPRRVWSSHRTPRSRCEGDGSPGPPRRGRQPVAHT